MFRRLAEAFQTEQNHVQFINEQEKYFKTMPNLIPSATSGLKGFDQAIASTDTNGKSIQESPIPYPNDIFRSDVSPELLRLKEQCATSSLDQLIASRNPSLTTGCGWLYTPPNAGSPYPQVSTGFIGNQESPMMAFGPPAYKKWFFDLEAAKKQSLIDRCKALKNCNDVDQGVYKGVCGMCLDTNQGIPIDKNGQPLYPNDPLGGCSADSIVRSADRCPPPPPVAAGPQPFVDRTCDPVDGRLSAACLRRQVLAAGCSDRGSLAIALAGSPPPSDYVNSLRNADAVKVYNRVANPPLSLDLFRQGRGTVDQVLQEARQLNANTGQPESSAMGAAARDLCLRQGAISAYDMCLELEDSATAPFSIDCLQKLFLKMGGQPKGSLYPSDATLPTYHSLGNWGAVKAYLQKVIARTNSSDYNDQREAMIQFLGISPEKSIQRAPYKQGVEVFWLIPQPGNPRRMIGFLRRTIERDVQFLQAGPSRVPQISSAVGSYAAMLQLTDIRAPSDFSVKFQVTIDDGFWITNNQPADFDRKAFEYATADQPGWFENNGLQGPTLYRSEKCTEYKSSTPNVTKLFFQDAGGGWNAFQFAAIPCAGTSYFQDAHYSLTCEPRAPFLTYETNVKSGSFEELRNPGIFSQFLGLRNLEYHLRSEERATTPGKKGFIRINNANSLIDMPNIAFQSWKTITMCVRLHSMPVKDTLFKFAMAGRFYSIVLTPTNGSTASVSIEHNFKGSHMTQTTSFFMSLNKWYLVGVHNWGSAMTLFINGIDEMATNGYADGVRIDSSNALYSANGTWNQIPGQTYEQCTIMLGTNGFANRADWPAMYGTASFQYDLAWIHFFDPHADGQVMMRECKADWVYTSFPTSYNQYRLNA